MKMKGDKVSEILSYIASIPLFADLSEASLTSLAEECKLWDIEKGDFLFFQGDPPDAAYIVLDGTVSIVLHSVDGREMIINEMHRGELLGELGILTKKNHSTSAVARTKSQVLAIPSHVLRKLIESEHKVTLRLLEITADRLQMSGKREGALAFLDAQARLARLLLDLEEQEQYKGYVTISQDELAQRTGLIRQTVAKALGKWRRAGWLITGRGRILILNRKKLEELEDRLLI